MLAPKAKIKSKRYTQQDDNHNTMFATSNNNSASSHLRVQLNTNMDKLTPISLFNHLNKTLYIPINKSNFSFKNRQLAILVCTLAIVAAAAALPSPPQALNLNTFNQINYLANQAQSDESSVQSQRNVLQTQRHFTTHNAHNSQNTQQTKQQYTTNTACQLPQTWAGKWTQSKDKESVRITNTEISDKGICRDQKGDKFLIESYTNQGSNSATPNKQQQQSCLICLVINERHLNVLQYKESTCQPIPANFISINNNVQANKTWLMIDENHALLESICADITGDAQLESLFRIDTPPIECPISGQFSFSYDNCREPVSTVESCVDKKQLIFKYGSCSEVPNAEVKNEVLKCYADWSEGNNMFMIGRLENTSNAQDKGKFRCFLYEKSPDGRIISMTTSSEESCYGLTSPTDGPRTMRLISKAPSQKCSFPSFIKSQGENWLSVDNSLIYMFNQQSSEYQVKEIKEGSVIEEAVCLKQFVQSPLQSTNNQEANSEYYQQQVSPPSLLSLYRSNQASYQNQQQQVDSSEGFSSSKNLESVFLVQITKNCYSTTFCAKFYKRSNGIVQIDYFPSSPDCRTARVGNPRTQILTSTSK